MDQAGAATAAGGASDRIAAERIWNLLQVSACFQAICNYAAGTLFSFLTGTPKR